MISQQLKAIAVTCLTTTGYALSPEATSPSTNLKNSPATSAQLPTPAQPSTSTQSSTPLQPSTSTQPSTGGTTVTYSGYIISIQESALFQPGRRMSPSSSVNGVRVGDDGEKVATINGTNLPTGKLRVGESVTQKDAGRFALTGITPASGEAKFGGGGIAYFCYEPAPSFELSPGVADGN